jgi:hypothetical protein
MDIQNVDICCGLAWGDESKGKIHTCKDIEEIILQ